MEEVQVKDLGTIDYQEAWDLQGQLLKELIAVKKTNRALVEREMKPLPQQHYFLFCHITF